MGRVSEGVGRTARQSAAHGKGVPRASRPHIELEPAHTPAHMPLTVTHSQDANGCSLDDKMSALPQLHRNTGDKGARGNNGAQEAAARAMT